MPIPIGFALALSTRRALAVRSACNACLAKQAAILAEIINVALTIASRPIARTVRGAIV